MRYIPNDLRAAKYLIGDDEFSHPIPLVTDVVDELKVRGKEVMIASLRFDGYVLHKQSNNRSSTTCGMVCHVDKLFVRDVDDEGEEEEHALGGAADYM